MAADAGPHSRAQICRKYGITEKTLRGLEKGGILDLTWEARHGLMVADVSALRHRRILTAARNHIYSFGRVAGVARVPFQRFLFLRFLQLPVEDIYDELINRNLIHPRGFPLARLKEMRAAFIAEIPRPLRKKVNKYEPPSTATEKQQLEILLRVCEIEVAYEHPELEQSLACLADPEVKLALDLGLSTIATVPDVVSFLEDVAAFTIPHTGLLFYCSMFHDLSFLDSEEVQAYLKSQKPSHRQILQQAVGQPLSEMRKLAGLGSSGNERDTLVELLDRARTDLYASMLEPRSVAADREYNARLKNYLMLYDRVVLDDPDGGGGKGGVAVPDIFDRFEMKISTMSGSLFQLPQPHAEQNSG